MLGVVEDHVRTSQMWVSCVCGCGVCACVGAGVLASAGRAECLSIFLNHFNTSFYLFIYFAAVSYYTQRWPFSPGLVGLLCLPPYCQGYRYRWLCPASVWVLGGQTQVLTLVQQALPPLSHLWPHVLFRGTASSVIKYPAWCRFPRLRQQAVVSSLRIFCALVGRRTCRENDLDIIGAAAVILAG